MSRCSAYSDVQLVTLLKEDDAAAFAELYERYWELLFGMAYNRLKDAAQAEDVVHDVFAALWKNRSKVQIQSPRAWLATAVKYMILRAATRASLFRNYSREETARLLAAEAGDTGPADTELSLLLAAAIDRLPEKCRVVFQLRQQGLSNSEVADAMNTTLKTVENQINKGLRALRVALKHYLFSFF